MANQLITFQLPTPPPQYDRRYMNELVRRLESSFTAATQAEQTTAETTNTDDIEALAYFMSE